MRNRIALLLIAATLLPAIPARAQSPLPFDRPALGTLRKSPHKVFAHFFPPFPISIDNRDPASDYYAKGYLDPNGEGGKWLSKGGFIRERPLPRPPYTDADKWWLHDTETEVRRAIAIGIDGFTVDILGTPQSGGPGWTRAVDLLETAQRVDPGFEVVLMPDMYGALHDHPEQLTDVILALSKYPSAYRLEDGRLVVSPWGAMVQKPQWWANWIKEMDSKGVKVALIPCFMGWHALAADYAPVCWGMSDWGNGSIAANDGWDKMPAIGRQYAKLWMQPVRAQDYRPKDPVIWEAGGSEQYRKTWQNAIDGHADWVQIATWSDYSESTEISPSTGTQYSYYDLTAYYNAWFKTGKQPKITRDVLYYFHRIQRANAPYNTSLQSHPTGLATGSDPLRDQVELLAFLTKPGRLEIDIAGKTYTQAAPAGITSFKVPLAVGTPQFKLLRAGKTIIDFASAFPVVDHLTYQDLLYRGGSSSRPPVDMVQTARP